MALLQVETRRYNPRGNGQVERDNVITWKTITLALRLKNLLVSQWKIVLPDALHSIRSLLSTATNYTPHERILSYQWKTPSEESIPTWLTSTGIAMLKRHIRNSKFAPLVETEELLVNPMNAHVRH